MDDEPERRMTLVEEAQEFQRLARRAEAVALLPTFFLPINVTDPLRKKRTLRGALKDLQKVGASLNVMVGQTLLSGVAPTNIKRDDAVKALDMRINNFANWTAPGKVDKGGYDAEYCDEMDTVSVFEKIPNNCYDAFTKSHVKDVVRTMRNAASIAFSMWSRTAADVPDDPDADIEDQLDIMNALHGRQELDYVLKFVKPQARFCFNVFVHEIKVVVAACDCKRTRTQRLVAKSTRSVAGMIKDLMINDPCDEAKVGGARKKAATKKKPAAKKPAAKQKKKLV
jgi:hypothetical protein